MGNSQKNGMQTRPMREELQKRPLEGGENQRQILVWASDDKIASTIERKLAEGLRLHTHIRQGVNENLLVFDRD